MLFVGGRRGGRGRKNSSPFCPSRGGEKAGDLLDLLDSKLGRIAQQQRGEGKKGRDLGLVLSKGGKLGRGGVHLHPGEAEGGGAWLSWGDRGGKRRITPQRATAKRGEEGKNEERNGGRFTILSSTAENKTHRSRSIRERVREEKGKTLVEFK